jgi:hypothetical protein
VFSGPSDRILGLLLLIGSSLLARIEMAESYARSDVPWLAEKGRELRRTHPIGKRVRSTTLEMVDNASQLKSSQTRGEVKVVDFATPLLCLLGLSWLFVDLSV